MAINPVSSSFPSSASAAVPASVPQTPIAPPSLAALQAMEGSAIDPMLIDQSTSTANQQGTSNSVIDNFNSMIGGSGTGDPLLNDLNSMDNTSLVSGSSDPAALEDAALNQGLTSFLMDQATSSYTASQLLGGSGSGGSSSTGSLGNTTA